MTEMDDLLIRGLSCFGVKRGAGAEIYLRLKEQPQLQEQFMDYMADHREATAEELLNEARRISEA
ncbi:MAG: hypothetical protein U0O13_04925 [Oscillospiraceae bacterium]